MSRTLSINSGSRLSLSVSNDQCVAVSGWLSDDLGVGMVDLPSGSGAEDDDVVVIGFHRLAGRCAHHRLGLQEIKEIGAGDDLRDKFTSWYAEPILLGFEFCAYGRGDHELPADVGVRDPASL
jgi:hypothetical protein